MLPKIRSRTCSLVLHLLILSLLFAVWAGNVLAYPFEFKDDSGNKITIKREPERVVSLVPGITEIILEIGAGHALKGITYHSTHLPGTAEMKIVGGFFSPDPERIEEIEPDLILYSSLQKEVRERFTGRGVALINLETSSLRQSYDHILLLGRIFNRMNRAEEIVRGIQDELDLVHKKAERIPPAGRKRVIRIMGLKGDALMAPGDDSFQNEMIHAAGGIPPRFNKSGQVVYVNQEEWNRFNPQVVYTCGGQREDLARFLDRPGWRDVDAFQSGRILDFPCDLTCRAATHTGDFVSWLSANIYPEDFAEEAAQVLPDGVRETRTIPVPLDYVKKAQILYSRIRDFRNKSVIIDFTQPMSVLSSLEGFRQGIDTVGNHYSSPPCWVLNHDADLCGLRKQVLRAMDRPVEKTSILFTGADMDNLSVQHAQYREMEAWALVTAGVRSNAVRMSADPGNFYEPGTINIILLTSRRLTRRAMTRAVIGATEAKTAALQDMDIRSSYSSPVNQATGTGTDNVIVVQGTGRELDQTGGHCKMGELIASAVYQGVKEAVYKQNGMHARRDVFQRLKERRIHVPGLVSFIPRDCGEKESDLAGAVEALLLQPEYSSFVTSSLALSDAYEKGLVKDLESFRLWCRAVAERIAQTEIEEMAEWIEPDGIPVVIRMSLDAILNGIVHRKEGGSP